ncbi:MAG: L-aspartate oxidase [bacterium]|nr:L-aspartate oxidase [bacterium]
MTSVDRDRTPLVVATDVVIIGGGIAGLTAALHARPKQTTIVCKSIFGNDGSSPLAQGGIAAAMDLNDSAALHARDTVEAGCGLTDEPMALQVTLAGPTRIGELIALGACFDRDAEGELMLGKEGAHSTRRIVHASGDQTGAEVVRVLKETVCGAPSINVLENTTILRLLVLDERVVGVMGVDTDGRRVVISASAVVLATGGIGGLFRYTTNPVNMRGDGLALASAAGAQLDDLEFVQFHPTALADGSDPMALITEAMRGEGALLLDQEGHRLMTGVHPRRELAPRDIVARRIWRVMERGGTAFLDARHLAGRMDERFPTVCRLCDDRGIDPRRDLIPVAPAAHYHMGGVLVDAFGKTSVAGLWACGEVARTGLHGANRLASNSLLEALVFGARVGDSVVADETDNQPSCEIVTELAKQIQIADNPWIERDPRAVTICNDLRVAMWRLVGLERDASGMESMIHLVTQWSRDDFAAGISELGLTLMTAGLVTKAALNRSKNVGAHYRTDSSDHLSGVREFRRSEGEISAAEKSAAAR